MENVQKTVLYGVKTFGLITIKNPKRKWYTFWRKKYIKVPDHKCIGSTLKAISY